MKASKTCFRWWQIPHISLDVRTFVRCDKSGAYCKVSIFETRAVFNESNNQVYTVISLIFVFLFVFFFRCANKLQFRNSNGHFFVLYAKINVNVFTNWLSNVRVTSSFHVKLHHRRRAIWNLFVFMFWFNFCNFNIFRFTYCDWIFDILLNT